MLSSATAAGYHRQHPASASVVGRNKRETPAVASPPAKTQAVPTLRRRGDRLPDTHVRAGRLVGTCAPFGPKMQRTGGAQACVGLVSRQRVD